MRSHRDIETYIKECIENDLENGLYVGRAEIIEYHPTHFKSTNLNDMEKKIKNMRNKAGGKKEDDNSDYAVCDCIKFRIMCKSACLEKPYKTCKNNPDYFSDCTRIRE